MNDILVYGNIVISKKKVAPALSLKYNRTTITLYAVLLGLGLSTYFSIGRLEYPEFTIRNAQIFTRYPGRTAIQVEQEVTEPLEQAVRQMEEVKEVKSTSRNGYSVISVELEENLFELEPIWQRLRNKVAATELPDGVGPPSVNDEFGDVFPFIYALRGDGFSQRELLDYAEEIRDELLAMKGVAKVEFHGVVDERVFVEFSTAEFSARSVSPLQLAGDIGDQNAVASSGTVTLGEERVDVATLGEFEDLDELRNLRLAMPGQQSSVLLSDFADVRRGYEDPPRSLAHYNGERVICLAVSMVKGGIVTEVGDRVDARLQQIQQRDLPVGLDVETIFFQPKYVAKSIEDFVVNLGQAFGFVALVMLLFAGWRIALVVAMLVPSAVLLCFATMPLLGVQLEMMSIAALIIALGLLVDNAVVVSEQILVRLGRGEDRAKACSEAVGSLAIPLLAASCTTVAAFSPIAMAPGAVSEFTYSLFAVVTLTLLSSWVLSLTVIPLFCYYFLKPLKRDTFVGRLLDRGLPNYESALRFALRRKAVFLILIVGLTALATYGFGFVPSIFFPPNERGQFVVDFELPLGRDIEVTEARVSKFEKWLLENFEDEVHSVSSWIGNGGPRWYLSLNPEPANPNYAFLSVLTTTEDPADIKRLTVSISEYARDAFPDARVSAKALENGPPVGDPIQIRLYGRDLATIYACRDRIAAELREVSGVTEIRDDWGPWVKQVAVDPDPVQTARLGLSTREIASTLSLQYRGLTVSQYREGEDAIPIVLRPYADYRERPERIRDVPVVRANGSTVPLSQVADVSLRTLPGAILREDTLRTMTIKAKVFGRFASAALSDIRPRLKTLLDRSDWPSGYRIEYGGEQEESAEAQGNIGSVFPIAFAFLSLILIAQFNSLRRFVIVVLTIPPMLCGISPGLLVTGSSFGFMTLLGIIALLGIIVNNAILLIDEIDVQLGEHDEQREAIIAASKSRLRPILMTTTTTIIGLLPLAVSGGGMWSSMANAMMFGLGFATVLTLVLCPVLFDLFFRGASQKKA
ncbi:MAG: efflux RND transporter permease subunit [Planctomycetota bacterium]